MNTLKQSAKSPDEKLTKDECNKEMKIFRNKLFELQNMFYADGRFSILIVLQGMDDGKRPRHPTCTVLYEPHGHPGKIL